MFVSVPDNYLFYPLSFSPVYHGDLTFRKESLSVSFSCCLFFYLICLFIYFLFISYATFFLSFIVISWLLFAIVTLHELFI